VIGSLVAGLAAFAIGRALPPAVALGARRRVSVVRPWILGLGCLASAAIGLYVIEAEYEPVSATLTALLPAWFALGILRPQLLPGWFPGNAKAIGLVLVLVSALVILPLGLLSESSDAVETSPTQAVDTSSPIPSFERIAPLLRRDTLFTSTSMGSAAGGGVGFSWELGDSDALDGFSDLHVEVWAGLGPENWSGISTLDPAVTQPLGMAAVDRTNPGLLTAELAMPLIPERDHYLVALVGTDPEGERRLLAQPEDVLGRWSGSVWDYLTAERPW
jgi:hypothetical protein